MRYRDGRMKPGPWIRARVGGNEDEIIILLIFTRCIKEISFCNVMALLQIRKSIVSEFSFEYGRVWHYSNLDNSVFWSVQKSGSEVTSRKVTIYDLETPSVYCKFLFAGKYKETRHTVSTMVYETVIWDIWFIQGVVNNSLVNPSYSIPANRDSDFIITHWCVF